MQVITRAWTGEAVETVAAEVTFTGQRASRCYAWRNASVEGDSVTLSEHGYETICQDAERLRDELERRAT